MLIRILLATNLLILLAACGSSKDAAGPGWGGRAADEGYAKVVAKHKADAYDALARAHLYEARGKTKQQARALDEAMAHVRALTQMGVGDDDIRELYRSVVIAYEGHYGTADTTQTEYGDVFALRDEMFETLNDLEEPLAEDESLTEEMPLPEVERLGETVPMTTNRLVAQSISFLQKNPEKHVYRWMERSGAYFPMIEHILREEGVPDELKYLATIESGLNPRARSRVGAGGMWQFMPATGRAYGLDISSWVDERSDPEKATRAAARHLRDLYESFDDWLLSLAAYNCGPTRVRRAVDRYENATGRTATFWDIYEELPRETRNYVPMYIAARMVMSDPGSFGLSAVQPLPAFDYDVVQVEGPMDLQAAADLADASTDELRDLNPEIISSIIPASSYSLRVPSGSAERFNRAYAALPEPERGGGVQHRVARGESLSRIASRYGTTVAALRAYNNISSSIIHPGDVLIVPVRQAPAGRSYSPPVMAASYRSSGPSAPSEASTHTVRRGDNLTQIARRYGMSVASLRAANNLRSDRIYPGQRLVVHGSAPSRSGWFNYSVRRGDTLSKIAARYDTTAANLRKWNALSTDVIHVGQELAIYGD